MGKEVINFYAHRGRNNHSFKDNSKEAVINALNKKYIKGIEIDIRLTKDKKVVICHNPFVFINGKMKMISETHFIELYKSNVYKLSELLSTIKTDKLILLEIKYESKLDKSDVDVILSEINQYHDLNIYLCSFNRKFIKHVKKKYDGKCGLIIGSLINRYKAVNFLDFNLLKYNLVLRVPKKESFIWTINDLNKLKRLMKNNRNQILNIITDKAYLLNDNLP